LLLCGGPWLAAGWPADCALVPKGVSRGLPQIDTKQPTAPADPVWHLKKTEITARGPRRAASCQQLSRSLGTFPGPPRAEKARPGQNLGKPRRRQLRVPLAVGRSVAGGLGDLGLSHPRAERPLLPRFKFAFKDPDFCRDGPPSHHRHPRCAVDKPGARRYQ
jgi:hypothetical protein